MKKIIKTISVIFILPILILNVSAEETFRQVYNENLIYKGIVGGSNRIEYYYPNGIYSVEDKSTHRLGAIDTYGNIIIPCQYKDIGVFKDGICSVITPDGENYFVNSKNEVVYKISDNSANNPKEIMYIKHGNYGIFSYDNMYVWLVDSEFKNTVEGSLKFIQTDYYWYFIDDRTSTENVYNYKGENLTRKLEAEGISPRNVFACGKYLGGTCIKDDRTYIKVFDINGKVLADFEGTGCKSANSNFIIGNNGAIYNTKGKELFSTDAESLLFDNYVVLSKRNGTSAIIDKEGNKVIDFGKWDKIYPTANSNVYVVGIGGKYGLADKAGSLIWPLEYNINGLYLKKILPDNGKYVQLNDSKNQAHIINVFNMKTYVGAIGVENGLQYISAGLDGILNDNFEYVASATISGYASLIDGVIVNKKDYLDLTVLNDNGGTKVKVDGEYLTFEKYPEIINGRTLVPLRKIFEAIGAEVIWNGADQSITAIKDDITIKMQINNNTLIKNGQSSEMDVCPQLIDGYTMVPVRAISDCFNILVDWNEYSHTVSLFTD